MVLHHALDVQVLNCYELIIADQMCRELVQEISADVGNLFMNSGDPDPRLFVIAGSRELPRKPSLLTNQLPGKVPENTGISHGMSIAVGAETFQSDVKSDLAARVRQKFRFFADTEGNEILPGGGTADGGAMDLPVKEPALLDFHKADLWQLDPVSRHADAAGLIARPVGLAMSVL